MKYSPAPQPGGPVYAGGDTFTGKATFDGFLRDGKGGHVMVNRVTFEPGSRTFWHSHTEGQVLLVAAGHGVVETRDGARQHVHAGDSVWAAAGEVHWHGAAPDSVLVQAAVSLGETVWAEEVPEARYQAAFRAGADDAGEEGA
jgi:quercetin dioxygenase-like cupin family protein